MPTMNSAGSSPSRVGRPLGRGLAAGRARGASCMATEMPKLPSGSSSALSMSTRMRPGTV